MVGRKVRHPSCCAHSVATMTISRTTTIRGCEIVHEIAEGRGGPDATPFVWGHGLTSSRAAERVFPLLDLDRLAEQRTVVRYDARGHGESGDITDPAQGSWEELAIDQVELIDHLGFDRVMIGGASMGTATALHSALMLGDRVERLLLVIPPTAWESRQAQIDQYEQMASIVEAKGIEPLVAGAAATPPPDPFTGDPDWTDRSAARLRAADPVRLAALFRGAGHADLPARDQLGAIRCPTLVLAWSGDPGHPVSTAEQLGELLSDVEVSIASTFDEFAAWTDLVERFLSS